MIILGCGSPSCVGVQTCTRHDPALTPVISRGDWRDPSGHIQGTCRRDAVGNDEKDRELIPKVTACYAAECLVTAAPRAVRELQVSHDLHGLVVEA